jgi:hypothetical protein
MVFRNIEAVARLTGVVYRILDSFSVYPLQATCNLDNFDLFLLIRP